jgi:hypothetical protein
MPRRGSRAQLLRDIHKWEARILSGFRDEQVDPEDLVGSYDNLSTEELREFVKREEITPARRGAPSKAARGTRNLVEDRVLIQKVDKLMVTGLSERSACRTLAAQFTRRRRNPTLMELLEGPWPSGMGVGEQALRKLVRDIRKRGFRRS